VRKTLIAILMALALVVIPVGSAFADNPTADVTVYATPTFISITNSQSAWNLGVVAASSHNNTGTGYFAVTNDSTVNITVTIQCTSTWEGGANDWTYGAPAENTAQLKASAGTGAYTITVLTASAVTLYTTTTAGDDFTWELQLDAPTSFTFGNAQQCTVTITAAPV